MVFHWSLSDSKSPQVSRTRLRILAVLRNAVIWIVSTRPPTSKSSRPFNNPLVIVPKAPITIGKIVTFIFHSFFNSLARSRYLSFFSHSFKFILWSVWTTKSTILQILFFFVDYYKVYYYYYYYYYCFNSSREFSHQPLVMVLPWSMRDSKSPRASRTLLSILADSNAVVWMISIRSPISKFFKPHPFTRIWWPFQVYQLQLALLFLWCSTAFCVLRQGSTTCVTFRFL